MNRGIDVRAAAHGHFGDDVRRRERQEDRGAIDRVRDTDIVRNVREDRLGVRLDIVDDRLVVRHHEHLSVVQRESATGGDHEHSSSDTMGARGIPREQVSGEAPLQELGRPWGALPLAGKNSKLRRGPTL